VASLVIGLAVGFVRLWTGIGLSGNLQLHSVGHVNHTAIYIAIMLGVCAAWIFARWRAWRRSTRVVAAAVAALVLVSLVVTASRGAIGVGLALLVGLGLAWLPRWRVPAAVAVTVVALVAVVTYKGEAEVVRRQEQVVATKNVLNYRDGVWRAALAAWERFPWFGIGMDNYSQVTPERVKQWRADLGKDYDAANYYQSSHAHSLYVNTMAERGVVGAAALGAVFLAWTLSLLLAWWRRPASDHDWLLWGGAASALVVSAGIGLVNTTLHHEHGLLSALLLGLWLSRIPARRAS